MSSKNEVGGLLGFRISRGSTKESKSDHHLTLCCSSYNTFKPNYYLYMGTFQDNIATATFHHVYFPRFSKGSSRHNFVAGWLFQDIFHQVGGSVYSIGSYDWHLQFRFHLSAFSEEINFTWEVGIDPSSTPLLGFRVSRGSKQESKIRLFSWHQKYGQSQSYGNGFELAWFRQQV